MAIKYPGQQKIGYGKAQVFDTSKLAEGAKYAAEKFSFNRKQKKKAKDDFVKNLKEIDVSKIRQVDTDYITSQVNAVSEYFYKNSAAILNPKLDGGKAAMEVQRLKSFAVGEVQKSIGIKEEDKALSDKIASDKNHFGTTYNYDLHYTRTRTAMNDPMWDDRETPTTYTEVDLSMTEEERADFYSKSKLEQEEILKGRLPSQQLLNQYQSIEDPKEKQEFLLEQGFELPQYGADGDFGDESKSAESKFLERQQTNIENESAELGRVSDISGYENYQDYQQGVSTDLGDGQVGAPSSMLTEQEFDNLQEEYNRYETTWNESQGTFDVTTEGGETIVGLHNRQIEANPMLGDHIREVASKIQFNESEISKVAEERVGEGNVNIFEVKKEIAKEQIINGIKMSIENHRFNPEMMKELNAELSVRQQSDANFTIEDLILEKTQPFIKNESKINFVKDIFKTKPTKISIGGTKPKNYEFAAPLDQIDMSYELGAEDGDVYGAGNKKVYNYKILTEGGVNGAEISQVVGSEGTSKDLLEINTTSKGFQSLAYTKDKKGKIKDGTNWTGTSGSIKLNPSYVFPAPVFTENKTVKDADGNFIRFKKGDRIPDNIEGVDFDFKKSFYPTINDEGNYEFPEGVKMGYFLQGRDDASKMPVLIEYKGQVKKQIENWLKRQTDDNRTVTHFNNILGIGTNRAD